MNAISKKTLTATLGALALGATLAATTAPASAQNFGAGLALGIIGGAVVGGAIASSNAYAAPAYGYGAYGGGCGFQRRPVYNAWGDVVGFRRIRVCY